MTTAPRPLLRAYRAACEAEKAADAHLWDRPTDPARWEAWTDAAHAKRAAAQAIVDWRGPAGIVDRLLARLGLEVA